MPMPTTVIPRNDPDGIISSVLQRRDLLTKELFPFLNESELGLSAASVCSRWAEASRDDGLWHIIAVTRWPSMVTTLIEAGVLDPGINDSTRCEFRSFCRRRLSPTPPSPSLTEHVVLEDDELWILLDMPNLIEEEGDGDDGGAATALLPVPPTPLQRAFRLQDTFRRHVTDWDVIDWEGQPLFVMGFYPEAPCECAEGEEEHDHPSAWMRLRLYDDFRAHPRLLPDLARRTGGGSRGGGRPAKKARRTDDGSGGRPAEEDLFELKISVLRRSDGKIATLVDPSSSASSRYDCDLPAGLRAVWVKHCQTYQNSHHSIEEIARAYRHRGGDSEQERGIGLRVKAGLNGDWIMREEKEREGGTAAAQHQADPRQSAEGLRMTINHIEFGLQLYDDETVDDDERDDDEESPNMINPESIEDLNWFFQRTGLAWT